MQPSEKFYNMMRMFGIHPKTALFYLDLAEVLGITPRLLEEVPNMVRLWNEKDEEYQEKTALAGYVLGGVKNQIQQEARIQVKERGSSHYARDGELFLNAISADARRCWNTYRNEQSVCPVRIGLETPQNEECFYCIEAFPVELFGE